MAVKPQARIYTCRKCGWKKYVAPQSDALGPGEFYDACPECASEELETEKAGLFSAFGCLVEEMAGDVAILTEALHGKTNRK